MCSDVLLTSAERRSQPPDHRPSLSPYPPSPAALGIDDGAGILVHMVLASGMGRRLREHEAWEGLLHGAQLVLAGETAAPLGSGAAAEEAPQAPQAGRGCIIS